MFFLTTNAINIDKPLNHLFQEKHCRLGEMQILPSCSRQGFEHQTQQAQVAAQVLIFHDCILSRCASKTNRFSCTFLYQV